MLHERNENAYKFWSENLKKACFRHLCRDGRKILKWILQEQSVKTGMDSAAAADLL
jgi:hypothetical protein